MTSTIQHLNIIVTVDRSGGFGKAGKIPWDFPDDLAHFKTATDGNICIMGRNTYTDMHNMIISRKKSKKKKITEILPGRTSFVVTRDLSFKAPGATVVPSIRDAIQTLEDNETRQIFIIGGQRMFIEALPWTDTIYMTIIKGDLYGCDVHFPIDIVIRDFQIVDGSENENMHFITYKRKI